VTRFRDDAVNSSFVGGVAFFPVERVFRPAQRAALRSNGSSDSLWIFFSCAALPAFAKALAGEQGLSAETLAKAECKAHHELRLRRADPDHQLRCH